MLRAQICLAHIYYLINVCPPLATWLIAVCSPDFEHHMHRTLTRAKFKLPYRCQAAQRSCATEYLRGESWCCQTTSSSASVLFKLKWVLCGARKRIQDQESWWLFLCLGQFCAWRYWGTGKTVFNRLRVLLRGLWKCIGFPQLKKRKNCWTLGHWTWNQSLMAAWRKV